MSIARQHDETIITDLCGKVCKRLLVLTQGDGENRRVLVAYLELEDGGLHRFFCDAGLLFWREIDDDDGRAFVEDEWEEARSEEDIVRLTDLGREYEVVGQVLGSITSEVVDGGLEVRIGLGASEVVLNHQAPCTNEERTRVACRSAAQ